MGKTMQRPAVKSVDCPKCKQEVPIPKVSSTSNLVEYVDCPHCNHRVSKENLIEQVRKLLSQ